MVKEIKDKRFKTFFIAFFTFLLISFSISFLLFFHSNNYDFYSYAKGETTEKSQEKEFHEEKYSVSKLSGKSNILFAVKDELNNIDICFVVIANFDEKYVQIKCLDDKISATSAFNTEGEKGLKNYISSQYNIFVEKYAVFQDKAFKLFLSQFDGITINIQEKVNYKSNDFNLVLEQGQQSVSGDIAYKLLKICNENETEKILCDIVDSLLAPQNIEKSDNLFKTFVNVSVTDISIVDYTDGIEELRIYANAVDKFKPSPYATGG